MIIILCYSPFKYYNIDKWIYILMVADSLTFKTITFHRLETIISYLLHIQYSLKKTSIFPNRNKNFENRSDTLISESKGNKFCLKFHIFDGYFKTKFKGQIILNKIYEIRYRKPAHTLLNSKSRRCAHSL